jgi:PAS domain S-box-containing protein
MNWSIERKLPLFVTLLLLAVAIAQLTIGYGEVRQAARSLADARLHFVDSALVDLLMTGQQRSRITAAARDSAIVAFVRSGGQRGRDRALEALRRITNDTAKNARLELRDVSGHLLLSTGQLTVADSIIAPPGLDSAHFGPLRQRDTLVYFGVAAATAPAEHGGGIVQQVSRLGLSERTRRTLTGLSGGDLAFLFGNAAGDPWTDFASIVSAPPRFVRESSTPTRYSRGEIKRAIAKAVPGTPWMVVTELPSRLIAAPARAYLLNMTPLALLIVVIGAIAAWLGSRRMTAPLREITSTAVAIAAGDLDRRVGAYGDDEVGRLGRSFNTMAEQVGRSLQSKETMLRSVTETAHDAIVAADTDGVIRFWNPGAARMFGYAADEVLGQPLTVLMPQRYRDAHRGGMKRYLETREAHVVGKTVELDARRKDGTEFPIELSLGAASLDGGMSFTGVIRDITERRRTAEALQATNAELESFTYSVSHDLRAPLRAIHGFARILLEDHNAQLDPEAQRLLGVIDQNTRRMGQLIDDLLAFSRLGRREMAASRVDMQELARSVADEVRRAEPERQGGLEIKIDPLPPARGDRNLLRQVLSNLLQNAAKFTRERAQAQVEVGWRAGATTGAGGSGGSASENGATVYYVRDNGAGFDDRYVDKLFGVFQRLHSTEQFDGTGVGLAIVKRIVQRHGGRVWAEGKVNQGSTFYFSLPGEER